MSIAVVVQPVAYGSITSVDRSTGDDLELFSARRKFTKMWEKIVKGVVMNHATSNWFQDDTRHTPPMHAEG